MEIQRIERAIIQLAKAIESGKIEGITKEVCEYLQYKDETPKLRSVGLSKEE